MLDKTALIESSNHWFALLTLVGGIVAVLWAIGLILARFGVLKNTRGFAWIAQYVFSLGFLTTLIAVVGSLYYQFYLGIQPCELCWFARLFIYPQFFLFLFAWCKGDRKVFDYVMGFSTFGVVIGVYHQFLQMGYDLYKPCGTGLFVDCSVPTFVEYGFVTYPLMGVVTCVLTFLVSYTAKKFQR